MELFIFSPTLEPLGALDAFTSFRWVRRYLKCGEFELHVPLTFNNLSLLAKENIIYKDDGDTEAGIISTRNLKQASDGSELLGVSGQFLTSYLNRRIVWGTSILNTTVELAMRTMVTENCISPTNVDRIIPNLILGDLKSYPGTVDYQTSYSNLQTETESLSGVSELGNRIILDVNNKKLKFETYKGLNRSVNQMINPECKFSPESENVLEQEYIDSIGSYKNVVLVGGMGEGSARKMVTVGSGVGLNRFETFNDQKSLSNLVNNVAMTDTAYNALLTGKGNETLAITQPVQTFDSVINLNSNISYRKDFDLGDIATCISPKWGLTLDTRITEITEVYEAKGIPDISITFGNDVPTLSEKIKQLIN